MQSLILTQDGLQIADTPRPPLMPGDVRIEVRSVGICGTDLAIWRGEYEVELPIILGHEIAGVVHESSVPELKPGTVVTTEIEVSCARCWYCRHTQRRYCKDKEVLGVTADGGMAEYLSVPAELIHPLPEGVDATAGVFVEPLASAIKTYEQSPSEPNEPVVVIGSGRLGLLVAQVYDAYGANVVVVGKNRWQLGLVRQLGIPNTISSQDADWKEKVLDATTDAGPRIVVETTGNSDGLRMGMDIVRSGGNIALKSMYNGTFEINPTDLVTRDLTLYGTSAGPFDKAIDILDKGRIEVKRLITKNFKLEDGAKAFEFAAEPNTTKVVIDI
ncbi:MAG: zinc-binding dehydrogenase [Candidatus Thorarchaeota archaeon]